MDDMRHVTDEIRCFCKVHVIRHDFRQKLWITLWRETLKSLPSKVIHKQGVWVVTDDMRFVTDDMRFVTDDMQKRDG
ncbi:hypothetical protein D8B24_13890 [Verminephrobacter aporrectodeae subsp. tuberculatae]|nr:hypothetical protein [Verminephrobacter aporrectodeae subsp. tuberculatae]